MAKQLCIGPLRNVRYFRFLYLPSPFVVYSDRKRLKSAEISVTVRKHENLPDSLESRCKSRFGERSRLESAFSWSFGQPRRHFGNTYCGWSGFAQEIKYRRYRYFVFLLT